MTARPRPRFNFNGPDQPPHPVAGENPQPVQTPEVVPEELPAAAAARSARAPSRAGKRAVTFYVPPEAFRQLAVLAATTDRSVQDLMTEATDLLFQRHGLARIARVAKEEAV
jgi:hypothetical protein